MSASEELTYAPAARKGSVVKKGWGDAVIILREDVSIDSRDNSRRPSKKPGSSHAPTSSTPNKMASKTGGPSKSKAYNNNNSDDESDLPPPPASLAPPQKRQSVLGRMGSMVGSMLVGKKKIGNDDENLPPPPDSPPKNKNSSASEPSKKGNKAAPPPPGPPPSGKGTQSKGPPPGPPPKTSSSVPPGPPPKRKSVFQSLFGSKGPLPPGPPPPAPPSSSSKKTDSKKETKGRPSIKKPPVVNVPNDDDSISDLSDEASALRRSPDALSNKHVSRSSPPEPPPPGPPSKRQSVTHNRQSLLASMQGKPPPLQRSSGSPPLPPPPTRKSQSQSVTSSLFKVSSPGEDEPPPPPSPINSPGPSSPFDGIHLQAFHGDVVGVRALLQQYPQALNRKFDYSTGSLLSHIERSDTTYRPPPLGIPGLVRDALKIAAASAMSRDQRWLLSNGFGSSTLLHYASAGDQRDMVHMLLGLGADRSARNTSDRDAVFYTTSGEIEVLLWSEKTVSHTSGASEETKDEWEMKKGVLSSIASAPTRNSAGTAPAPATTASSQDASSVDATGAARPSSVDYLAEMKRSLSTEEVEEAWETKTRIKSIEDGFYAPIGATSKSRGALKGTIKTVMESMKGLQFPQHKDFSSDKTHVTVEDMQSFFREESMRRSSLVEGVDMSAFRSGLAQGSGKAATSKQKKDPKKITRKVADRPYTTREYVWDRAAKHLKEEKGFCDVRSEAAAYGQRLLKNDFKGYSNKEFEGLVLLAEQRY